MYRVNTMLGGSSDNERCEVEAMIPKFSHLFDEIKRAIGENSHLTETEGDCYASITSFYWKIDYKKAKEFFEI